MIIRIAIVFTILYSFSPLVIYAMDNDNENPPPSKTQSQSPKPKKRSPHGFNLHLPKVPSPLSSSDALGQALNGSDDSSSGSSDTTDTSSDDGDTTAPINVNSLPKDFYKHKDFNAWDKIKSFGKGTMKGFLGSWGLSLSATVFYKVLKSDQLTRNRWLCFGTLYSCIAAYGISIRNFFIFSPQFSNNRKDEKIEKLNQELNTIENDIKKSPTMRNLREALSKQSNDSDKRRVYVAQSNLIKLRQQKEQKTLQRNKIGEDKVIDEDLTWQTKGYWTGFSTMTLTIIALTAYIWKQKKC